MAQKLPYKMGPSQSKDEPTQPQVTYTIVAPAKVRPNSNYHVNLQLANATIPATFDVALSGKSNGTDPDSIFEYCLVKSGPVNASKGAVVNFEVGDWTDGTYSLTVTGKSSELDFKEKKTLRFEPKSFSFFVQTDKAMYKPGQTDKFRVIVVDPNLMPKEGVLDVYLKDPKGNLIKQWKGVALDYGLFAGELKLSEQPPLGDWSIKVELCDRTFSKTFTVAEYVLPIFSVDVILPPYATYDRSEIIATVKASYTYGKPVKGDVTLSVKVKHPSRSPPNVFETKCKLGNDGSVDIPVNVVRALNLWPGNYEKEIIFEAEVEESLTGKKYSQSSGITLYKKEVKVELIKLSNTFKPGLQYTAFLKVAYQDDKPVEDNGPAMKLKYCYGYDDRDWTIVHDLVPNKGLAQIDIIPPKGSGCLRWKAEYRGHEYDLDWIEAAQSPSNSFIQLVSKQDKLEDLFGSKAAEVGQKVTYQINSTEPLKEVTYQIIAKGDIVQTGTVCSTNSNETLMDLTIAIIPQIAPKARLLVFYIRDENHEVVADSVCFKVDGAIKTLVKLTSNVSVTKPGDQVDLHIETSPSAYVGLLGVDQSVLLLKSGNDITRDDVLQELESYDTGKSTSGNDSFWFRRWLSRFSSGATTAAEIFADAGLIILSNGIVSPNIREKLYTHLIGDYIDYEEEEEECELIDCSALIRVPCSARSYSDSLEKLESKSTVRAVQKSPEPVKLRQKFPETWIWSHVTAGSDGVAKYSSTIPDTITSWFISAFAIDPNTGLGVAEDKLKISVFRPFFISLSLPYSIIRGESVVLKVVVFNYQKKSISADVVMENLKEEFEFVNGDSKEPCKCVKIEPLDGTTLHFVITPKKLGNIDIQVRATADNAGDAILKKLLVKPEGQTQYFNKAAFIKLDQGAPNMKKYFTIDVPPNFVPGSLKAKVTGIAEILGPTLNNIDDLLRMPYGCGEQNMINLVPNIVVLNYLAAANRLTEAIKIKAVNNIESGYQRELTYRRDDGSFSAFGNWDKNGSTWLTAFVIKSFIQARPYLEVDPSVISQGIDFLLSRQQEDGSFVEHGEVHQKDLQGGSSETTGALTAYVLIAILHHFNSAEVPSNEIAIQKAEEYVFSRLSASTKPYEVALITYALQLADSKHKEAAFEKLMSLSKQDVDGLMCWINQSENLKAKPEKKAAPISDYLQLPNSLDVESSAYGLLSMVARGDTDNSLAILRWLISKQNSNGGFASTQDTGIGLQALGAIAEKLSSTKLAMTLKVQHGSSVFKNGSTDILQFSPDNALVLQQIELQPDTKWIEIDASGMGTAVVQVSYQYNIAEEAEKPAFTLKVEQDKTVVGDNIKLNICVWYKDGDSTNMAVMEVELPSGYVADLESLRSSTRSDEVKRVDTSNNDCTVIVYFDRVTKDKQHFTVPAYRAHQVANNKPVPVTIYDYYDRSKLSRVFYEPTQVSLNDVVNSKLDCDIV